MTRGAAAGRGNEGARCGLPGRRLGAVMLVVACSGAAFAVAASSSQVAVAAVHDNAPAKVQPCTLLTTAQVAAVVGVKVKAGYQAYGNDCNYTQAGSPTNPSAQPANYSITLSQDASSTAANTQFKQAESRLKPVQVVAGLGSASFWAPHIGNGTLWTRDGDFVLSVEGLTSSGKNVSKAANEGLMKHALAHV